MSWSSVERAALVETLLGLGPDSPTVCQGWQTRHLLAHLYLRQNHPVRSAGTVVPPLRGRAERAVRRLGNLHRTDRAYAHLAQRFLIGPPRWSPSRLGGDAANLTEYVIHHEDARRGAGLAEHRSLDGGMEAALRRYLWTMALPAYARDRDGVELRSPEGEMLWRRRGQEPVVLTGATIELLLHASGRARVADVDVAGPPEATARFAKQHA